MNWMDIYRSRVTTADEAVKQIEVNQAAVKEALKLKGGRVAGWITMVLLGSLLASGWAQNRWLVGLTNENRDRGSAVEQELKLELQKMHGQQALLVQEIGGLSKLVLSLNSHLPGPP